MLQLRDRLFAGTAHQMAHRKDQMEVFAVTRIGIRDC
jgi:hypothetical protein